MSSRAAESTPPPDDANATRHDAKKPRHTGRWIGLGLLLGLLCGVDGLIIAAEEGAAWNILYPEYAVVVPQPVTQRPVGMAVRLSDAQWRGLLDRWLDFERLDGSLDRLRTYWIEGGGTRQRKPRWCVMRDVLHWLP